MFYEFWKWCITHNIYLSESHSDFFNVEADELSRGLSDDLEWALDMDIFQEIVGRFDLLASRLNHKLDKYISFRSDPNAMAVDAFSIAWTKQYV